MGVMADPVLLARAPAPWPRHLAAAGPRADHSPSAARLKFEISQALIL
jgi:hypothetical protein